MSDRFLYLKINGNVERFEYTYDAKDERFDGTSTHTWNNIKPEQFLSPQEIAEHEFNTLPEEERDAVAKVPESDLIAYHHSYGRYLRNTYGLWHPTNPFVIKGDGGDGHPDGLSMLAIVALHNLCNKPKSDTAYEHAMAIVQEK